VVRTVVAFNKKEVSDSIAGMLEEAGISVRYRCHSGMEVIRAIKKMGGGVVICNYKLADMTADQMYYELQGIADFLVIAKPAYLELCENEGLFKLPMPVRLGELVGSVNVLIQLDQKRSRAAIPKRSEEDKQLIMKAKELLMEKNGMTEEQAHRYLQKKSMETSSKMTDTAKIILEAFDYRVNM
jgi:response regulator NasT